MTCNVGKVERSIRLGAGLLAVGAGLFAGLSSALAEVAMLVGAILLFTGLMGYCPLFRLIGVNTCASATDTQKAL